MDHWAVRINASIRNTHFLWVLSASVVGQRACPLTSRHGDLVGNVAARPSRAEAVKLFAVGFAVRLKIALTTLLAVVFYASCQPSALSPSSEGGGSSEFGPPPLTGRAIRVVARQLERDGFNFVARGMGLIERACPAPGNYQDGDTVYLLGINRTAEERKFITSRCRAQEGG